MFPRFVPTDYSPPCLSESWFAPRGYWTEGREYLAGLLALPGALVRTVARANALMQLGRLALEQGDYGAARVLFAEGLAIRRERGDKQGIGYSLLGLGGVALSQGEYGAARALYEEGLAIFRELGQKLGIPQNLEGLAAVAVAQEQPERAARLFGAAEGLREALGALLPPADRAEHDRCAPAVRNALGEEAFAAAWAEGRAMPLEEALGVALAESEIPITDRKGS